MKARSLWRFFAVIVVDAIAWPVNRAIDAMDFSDIGDDECPVSGQVPCPWHPDGGNHPGVGE